jgi:hypothetical protein
MTMALYKRARLLTIPLTLLLGWAAPAQGPAQIQNKGPSSFSPIVLPGQPSPDGGAFFSCIDCNGRIFGSRGFNTRQEVGFNAETDSPCLLGDFLVSAGKTVWLVGVCPRAPGGPNILGNVNLNERGDAAFLTGPIDSENFINPTILLYSGGQISVAAKNGDPTTGGRTDIGPLSKKTIFSEPFVNNNDEVSFWGSTIDGSGMEHFGVFSASGGKVRVVASDGDRSPVAGTFNFFISPSFDAINNDSGEILFQAAIFQDVPTGPEPFGLFLSTPDGFRKIVVSGDELVSGYNVLPGGAPAGSLNNNGDVAFCTELDNPGVTDSGVFLYSGGIIRKIVAQGDPSPIGGKFATFLDASLAEMVRGGLQRPELNSSDQVVFKAKAGPKGKIPALFMASPTAVLKIVAVGDVLPNGETIGEINTYSLNEAGEVAFVAYRRPGQIGPLGLWVASPVAPSIRSARLKVRNGSPALIVNGSGFITNDSVIEINGVALGNIDYPTDFQENGGTTTRIISSDPAILDLVSPGSTVQVTVRNRLTGGLVSGAFALTR